MRFWIGLSLIGCNGEADPAKDDTTDTPLPSTEEVCVAEVPYDGIDQDCDGTDLKDVDQDGFIATVAGGDDCDDDDPLVNPDATDIPLDDIDQDCVGGDVRDGDGDGVLSPEEGGNDCNDADPTVLPGAEDTVGNDVDDNCDGIDGVDRDRDGFAAEGSGGDDCNDTDPDVNPEGVDVWYDGIDQTCGLVCDFDQDGDGAVVPGAVILNGDGCDTSPGPEYGAREDCDDLDPLASVVSIVSTTPEDGASNIGIEAPVTIVLAVPDATATVVVVVAATGLEVAGTTAMDGSTLVWTPDAPLTAGTIHQVDVTHGCGVEGFTFESAWDVVVLEPADLVGNVFTLDIAGGDYLEPALLGTALVAPLMDALMIEVVGAGTDTLDLRLATNDAYQVQHLCAPTVDTVADFSANPALAGGPVDWPLADAVPGLLDARFEAGFRDDGRALVEVVVRGAVDTRPLVPPIFGAGSPPTAICDYSYTVGIPCTDCPNGAGPYCLDVRIENVEATLISGSIVPRTIDEIAADPACP